MAERADAVRATVFLVDDHPVLARGLAALLEDTGFEVTGIASSPAGAIAALSVAPTDLVVVDLSLEDGHGQDLVVALHQKWPALGIVVYSVNEDLGPIRRALEAGARGYVTKREHPEVLVGCLEVVRGGGTFLSPLASRAQVRRRARDGSTPPTMGRALSATELEVYRLVGEGCSSPEIAERLGIARGTVETYYDRIIDKLALGSRRDLRRHAIGAATRRD